MKMVLSIWNKSDRVANLKWVCESYDSWILIYWPEWKVLLDLKCVVAGFQAIWASISTASIGEEGFFAASNSVCKAVEIARETLDSLEIYRQRDG